MADLITRRAAIARAAYLLGGALSASTLAGLLAGCDRRAADATGSVLTGDRRELVATISEHILPATDTPGARDAGVHEFIDAMMSDYYPAEERDRFLAGLARLEERTQRAFGAPFLELDGAQQLQVVEAFNRQALGDPAGARTTPAQEPVLRETQTETGRGDAEAVQAASGAVTLDSDWDPEDVGRQSFFRTLKELVLVGYYTSEAGSTQELRVNPMGSWVGDMPYADVGQAWA